jgi:hypothetical protein
MTAQSNLFDFLDITDDMWYHDISYEADPNLQKYGCYVTNILSTRKLYIRPKQLEGMFTFSENRHELYIAVQQSWWSGPGAVTFKAMMLVFIFCLFPVRFIIGIFVQLFMELVCCQKKKQRYHNLVQQEP